MVMSEIQSILPERFRKTVVGQIMHPDRLREIRFRIGQPVELVGRTRKMLAGESVDRSDLKEMLAYISGYSLYAFEEEISQGFITIPGGHRVGVAGHVVVENGAVRNIRNISFINIRLSHEIQGCSEVVMPYLKKERKICNTLIISPPGCGKTTLLRDIVRNLSGQSSGEGWHVAVVDERSEIAGCYRGMPQNDLGCRTDVLDGCPKSEGMMMAMRSLSPEVIVADEIGGKKDVQALSYVVNGGCAIMATIHGETFGEIENKPEVGMLVKQQMFERYIVLENGNMPGEIKQILDGRGREL